MNDENVATRLKLFIDEVGLSNSQFADRCGIPRPSLSQLLTGRNKKVSDVVMGQIHEAFPELSVLWLMFGEGEMLTNPNFSASQNSENPESPGDYGQPEEYPKENGLGYAPDMAQSPGNKGVIGAVLGAQSKGKIAKNSSNPRRVTQITVYYDDSTFETFYPKGHK